MDDCSPSCPALPHLGRLLQASGWQEHIPCPPASLPPTWPQAPPVPISAYVLISLFNHCLVVPLGIQHGILRSQCHGVWLLPCQLQFYWFLLSLTGTQLLIMLILLFFVLHQFISILFSFLFLVFLYLLPSINVHLVLVFHTPWGGTLNFLNFFL